jgi:thiol-disulfide isomerase/thioredoxin
MGCSVTSTVLASARTHSEPCVDAGPRAVSVEVGASVPTGRGSLGAARGKLRVQPINTRMTVQCASRTLAWYHHDVRLRGRPLAALLITFVTGSCARALPPPKAQAANAPASATPTGKTALAKLPLDEPASDEGGASDDEELNAPAWLGVELAMRMPDEPGVLVRAVVPGSPAERAGLQKDDVIVSVQGQAVGRPTELISAVAGRRPGERVAISYLRGGADRLAAATLEALPNEESLMKRRYVDALAPSFNDLKIVQGNVPPDLAALRGRVVVLEFWATWCAPCKLTAPLLNEWSDQRTAEGLTVLGVTGDPVELAAHGARETKISYALFTDESGSTIRDYRAFALPTLFVIDRRGVVRDVMVGLSSERLRQIDRLVGVLLAER